MSTSSADVLSKLEQVKALMERASTPGEAEAAAAAFTKLLTKYNLTAAEFEHRSSRRPEDLAAGLGNHKIAADLDASWKRNLVFAVARQSGCRALVSAYNTCYWLVGSEMNVNAAREVIDYATEAINRLCDVAWAEAKGQTSEHWRTWKTSFKLGAVVGFEVALWNARREAIKENPNGSAIVAIDDKALQLATKRFHPRTGTARSALANSNGAFAAGRTAGMGMSPRRIKAIG